ncbi:Dps family protein [Eilatimonas milleporae]|uniref:Starvation-inducible DNA-binding protein n=1 Tax=Eilatimonas milleporae TaxID=911205 RepID=A0A3M0CUJ5_9PROT|nr:DNA starvation/stationary phase protection protein [Eilatimonas milleporae]RMB13082.1 starvation-inducible DNA-binding protein [Eilatimonas milleporae]
MTDQAQIDTLAASLKVLLAENVQLYTLTQNVHWNVTGPLFQAVHNMTEEQYLALATATDDIAERIRALGHKAPGTLQAYVDLGSITDGDETADAETMVGALVAGNETLAERLRAIISEAADAGDEVTAGIATDRLTAHEKTIWMLKALTGQ